MLPSLPDLVSKATKRELESNFNDAILDPIDLWFKVRDDLLIVSKFYLESFLKIRIESFFKSYCVIVKALKNRYYEHMAYNMARHISSANNPVGKDIITCAINLNINYRYISNIYNHSGNLPFGVLSLLFLQ